MIHLLNELRRNHGCGPIFNFNDQVGGYCSSHAWAMANEGRLYHASSEYLDGWSEAVARCDIEYGNWENTCRRIVLEVLGGSEGHRNLILGASELAYGFAEKDGILYLVVRTR